MNEKLCTVCGFPFVFKDGEEWKTFCIDCYKEKKRLERESLSKNPETIERIVYRDKIIYQDRIVYRDRVVHKEIPRDLISKMIRLCHPDKHNNSDSSNEVTKWLLQNRSK